MLARVILVLLLSLAILRPACATLILVQYSPTEILLGVDSLWASRPSDDEASIFYACKIGEEGNIFYSISGNTTGPIRAALRQAAKAPGGIEGIAVAFEHRAGDLLSAVPRQTARRRAQVDLTGQPERVDVVFVDARNHEVAHLGYKRLGDGWVHEPPNFYGRGDDFTDVMILGIHEEAFATVQPSNELTGIPFMVKFSAAQIAHEDQRFARKDLPRVGGGFSILRVAEGRAELVEGHQGVCQAEEN